jgi:Haem-binding domain/Cytochrome P460
MRMLGKLLVAGIVLFAALQFVRPSIPVRPTQAELQAPPAVKGILEKDCYSCHSDEKRLAWFDEIVPAYWLVRHDILTAREHLNFSRLGSSPAAAQKARLYEAVNMIQLGAMPLPQFVALHPDAKVTPEELDTLKAYLAPWTPAPDQPGNATPVANKTEAAPAPVSLGAVQAELNGFPFEANFESWKVISTTDRGDNNTFRFILGNDVAVEAAKSGRISPWPDGARFAKIAWQQEPGADSLIHPGKFVQVEFMLKDAQRYKDTEGWGWGRWRGLDLKPYGNDARFVNECTGCHMPVGGNDFVYTLPITTAKITRAEVVNNNAANLPASLPYQPLGWNAITMYVDPKTRTTATLYGNETAMQAVQPRKEPSAAPAYSAGSVLALVTWAQREDPHWFGARIPDAPQSVEFVQVTAAGPATSYRRFAGAGLIEDHPPDAVAAQRANFIAGLAPARLP